ncbi:phosphoribosylglycinamide formyltransferase [Marilutibacter chinensis]|uniref:Phosphoribosylglycinamide formyltransferase n=1 Tax=Marilutibacter chinensis TaxID=2912247 RepID=A0ABS9HUA3_9GAMM|nr:phosphoribosylglycinamide formyltransferase [Lysobacter chinensis]MCF7222464.1 phosphoribosylglycinamide formyltransferase [Lysobacter chinensis]
MRRIAVLASGRGSNLQALIDAIAGGDLAAEVVGVFSDRSRAGAVERARAAGIPAVSLRPRDFDTRAAFDEALFSRVDDVQPDLIVCAGYMRLLSADVVEAREGRMINIHPSLLPAFKGLHTHQLALDAGATEHGASVHFVTAELDGGPVIAQARVPVLPDDDVERLSARVLAREHPLLLATVGALVEGRVRLVDGQVCDHGRPLAAPLQLGDDDRLLG